MTNKYNARRTEVDGITFASKREAARYQELKLLESAGVISNLELQPRFELQPSFKYDGKTERALTYVADFAYCWDGNTIVEDSKGARTDVFKIKRKLLLFRYPNITFLET